MNPLPHRIVGTVGLLASAGAIAAGTLALTGGHIAAGTITLLCAAICATTAAANLGLAARASLLGRLATEREEAATKIRATYANAARIAGDSITISDLADAVDRWALVAETEKIAGATDEEALITALAATLAHDRKEIER